VSLATWKAEFYPKPANRVAKKDALAHSLQKWKGLTKAALKRHGLTVWGGSISDGVDCMFVGDEACALCVHYLSKDVTSDDRVACEACPLAKSRAGTSCTRAVGDGEPWGGPWIAFVDNGDARPMIRALQKAVRDANR